MRDDREEYTRLVERRDAAWNAHDAEALAATHAVDGVVVSPTGGVLEGRDQIARVYRLLLKAFPDVVFTTQAILIDGNRIAQHARVSGTHSGEFFGIAATGRRVEVETAMLLTVRDGLVAEERRIYDFTGLLIQVGVLKAKPGAT